MKKSSRVTLTSVAAIALAMCGKRRPDPCAATTFNEQACQEAVRSGGYYWQGSWYPMMYRYPYPYYYDAYRRHVAAGGTVVSAPGRSYGLPGASAPRPEGTPGSSSGVERGGFGSTGSGHASGSGAGE